MRVVVLAAFAVLSACGAPPPPAATGPRPLTAEEAIAYARTLPVYRSPEEADAGRARDRARTEAVRRASAAAVQAQRDAEFCRGHAAEFGVWTAGRDQGIVERQCLRTLERTRAFVAP